MSDVVNRYRSRNDANKLYQSMYSTDYNEDDDDAVYLPAITAFHK